MMFFGSLLWLSGAVSAWGPSRGFAARKVVCAAGSSPTGPRGLRVGIVGAGPAGLTQALAIRSLMPEASVCVFERGEEWQKPNRGGGVQLNSGAAVLAALGLSERVRAVGNPCLLVRSRSTSGETLLELDIASTLRGDARAAEALVTPSGELLAVTIMRDALQELLAEACVERFPGDALVQCGRGVVGVSEDAAGARLKFADGALSAETFDVVVAADGANSQLRRGVQGVTAGVRATGARIAWGVAPGGSSRPAEERGELHQWFGESGDYALVATYGGLDGELFDQCVLVSDSSTEAARPEEAWTARADGAGAARLAQRCEGAGMPVAVVELAQTCERVFELEAGLVNPLAPWVARRVALVGDAAHAAPPFLGQGTNQALQDAYSLARCLRDRSLLQSDTDAVRGALRKYERERKFCAAKFAFNSLVLGAVETKAPPIGRDLFFKTTAKLGIAKKVFLDGATPKVL